MTNNDELRGYYHVRLKCRKYYKYIFWFQFDLIVQIALSYVDISLTYLTNL